MAYSPSTSNACCLCSHLTEMFHLLKVKVIVAIKYKHIHMAFFQDGVSLPALHPSSAHILIK